MSSMVAGSMRGSEVRLDIGHNLAGAEATAISFMSGWGHEKTVWSIFRRDIPPLGRIICQ